MRVGTSAPFPHVSVARFLLRGVVAGRHRVAGVDRVLLLVPVCVGGSVGVLLVRGACRCGVGPGTGATAVSPVSGGIAAGSGPLPILSGLVKITFQNIYDICLKTNWYLHTNLFLNIYHKYFGT